MHVTQKEGSANMSKVYSVKNTADILETFWQNIFFSYPYRLGLYPW